MKRIRILLVEDNRILREGVTAIINAQRDMGVVDAISWNASLLHMCHELNPDVLLIDVGMRNQNGLEIVATVRGDLPVVNIIGMGLIPAQSDIVEFIEAGAAGFILKDAKTAEFLGTIRAVSRGEKVLPPVMTDSLFSHVIRHAINMGKGKASDAVQMTSREREIIALIAEGLSNKEIGRQLNVATYTVKTHVHHILEKLALRSRLQISAYAHTKEIP